MKFKKWTAIFIFCYGVLFLNHQSGLIKNIIEPSYALDTSEVSEGVDNVGFAPFNLTAPNFNCEGYLTAVKPLKVLHVAFLYNTFGNDFSCLKKLLKDPRLETLEINLINEPAHRNSRLGSYEFLHGIGSISTYERRLARRDLRLQRKFSKYVISLKKVLNTHLQPHTSLIINPGLESNVSPSAGKTLVEWARQEFSSARIVWNPLKPSPNQQQQAKSDLIEGHGFNPNIKAPCFYNMDGIDVAYPTRQAIGQAAHKEGQLKNWVESGPPVRQLLEEFANTCEVAFLWTAESNGINPTQTKFVDPRKRDHFVSGEMYKKIIKDLVVLKKRGKVYSSLLKYDTEDEAIVDSCDSVHENFEDGYKRGKLLKQSEYRERGAVLILPKSFSSSDRPFLVKGTAVIDRFHFSAVYKDGERLVFRSNTSPTTYPFNTYLVIDSGKKRSCYKLPNPRIRLD